MAAPTTAPKPLVPGVPDWASNLSGWVWLAIGVVILGIVWRTKGKSAG